MPLLEQALAAAGLSPKEARVYLAALELGAATATEVARKSGINRATTYLVAENLILRGLMSSVHRDTKRVFVAEPPQRLLARVKKEEETVEHRVEALVTVLPELEALVKADAARPAVRYYQGREGIATMREIVYRNRFHEVLSAVDLDAVRATLSLEEIRAHQKRLKLYDLTGRVLYACSSDAEAKILTESLAARNNEHRRVSRNEYPFGGELVIMGDTVALVSYAEGIVGTLIDHPQFAGLMRALFELAWRGAAQK